LSGGVGVGSQRESVEVFGKDQTKGSKTVEAVEEGALAGTLEPLGRIAVSMAEKLHALLVGVESCLSPKSADEPGGAGAEQGRMVEDELFGPG
jgi:hypothetical protein